jgi:hypothetical protein
MSNRRLKRKMIKEFGVEKASDIIRRKLKNKQIKDEKAGSRDIRPDKEASGGGA